MPTATTVNTLQALLSFKGVRYQTVTHARYGTFRLRSLTAEEAFRLNLDLWSADSPEKQRLAKANNDRELLSLSLVDELCQPILPLEQGELLDGLEAGIVSWLLYEARQWSGLNLTLDEVIRVVEGN